MTDDDVTFCWKLECLAGSKGSPEMRWSTFFKPTDLNHTPKQRQNNKTTQQHNDTSHWAKMAFQLDSFGRATQHSPDQFWNSTGRHLWDQVMTPAGCAIANIGMEDLVGDNSLLSMSTFALRCSQFPPASRRDGHAHAVTSCVDTLTGAIKYLRRKHKE